MDYAAIRLANVGFHQAKPDWKLGPQLHQHHELIVVISGRQSTEFDGVTQSVAAGDALWFPRQTPHTEWADPRDPVRSVFIGIDWLELPCPSLTRVTDVEGRLGQLAQWLYAEREHDPALDRPIMAALTQAIVAEYLRLTTQPADPLVGTVRKFMRQRLARPLALEELAAASGLSKFHFVRRYRALTGRTPMEDLRLIRLDAARDLLLTTNLPLKEIAPRCGLGDEYHLCRLFRQHLHATPGQLRRRRGA